MVSFSDFAKVTLTPTLMSPIVNITVPDLSPSSSASNQQSIFLTASYFHHAGLILNEEMRRHSHLVYPWSVNNAFAIELYLKCLLIEENISFPKIHNLKKLFDLLPSSTRANLSEQYLREASDPLGVWRMEKEGKLDLETDLENSWDAFEQLRYPYDGKRRNNTGFSVMILGKCIREVLLQRHPDWQRI